MKIYKDTKTIEGKFEPFIVSSLKSVKLPSDIPTCDVFYFNLDKNTKRKACEINEKYCRVFETEVCTDFVIFNEDLLFLLNNCEGDVFSYFQRFYKFTSYNSDNKNLQSIEYFLPEIYNNHLYFDNVTINLDNKTTLVTLLIDISKHYNRCNPSLYYKEIYNLLILNVPIVIYTNGIYYDFIMKAIKHFKNYSNNFKIINWEVDYESLIFKTLLKTCVDPYITYVTYTKLMIMKDSSLNDYFKTKYFTFVDAGITKTIKNNKNPNIRSLINEKLPDKIKVFVITHFQQNNLINDEKNFWKIFKHTIGGGIFTYTRENIEFLHDEFFKTVNYLCNNGFYPAKEQAIITKIAIENIDKFELTFCDYQDILFNWNGIIQNERFLYKHCVKLAREDAEKTKLGHEAVGWKIAENCCKNILNSWRRGKLKVDMEFISDVYNEFLMSRWYGLSGDYDSKVKSCEEIGEMLLKDIDLNNNFRNYMTNNNTRIERNFGFTGLKIPSDIHITIKVIVFGNWGKTPTQLKNLLENMYDVKNIPRYGKDIILTDNLHDYTHAIICNTSMPKLKIPKENVLGLSQEPPYFLNMNNNFINYATKHIGLYYVGDVLTNNIPSQPPFKDAYAFIFDSIHERTDNIIKTKTMSIIFSDQKLVQGHKYRHELVERILQSDLEIDIWGRGCKFMKQKYPNDKRLKGEFEQGSSKPYSDYKFHICIENFVTSHYISEKYTNCIITNSVPIYLGCKNIDKYFPGITIKIKGNVDDDMNVIIDVFNNPSKYKKDIEPLKEKLNNEFNLIKHCLELWG